MTIEWNDSYKVGLDILDSQHKELVERISVLLEAMRQGRGDVATILGVLEGYAIEHFDTEERLMSGTDRIDLVDLRLADPLLKFAVATTGKIVYERSPGEFSEFYSLAFRRYVDTKKLRDAQEGSIRMFLAERGLS